MVPLSSDYFHVRYGLEMQTVNPSSRDGIGTEETYLLIDGTKQIDARRSSRVDVKMC